MCRFLDQWVISSNSILETFLVRVSPLFRFFATSTIIVLPSENWRRTYPYPHKIANGGFKNSMRLSGISRKRLTLSRIQIVCYCKKLLMMPDLNPSKIRKSVGNNIIFVCRTKVCKLGNCQKFFRLLKIIVNNQIIILPEYTE